MIERRHLSAAVRSNFMTCFHKVFQEVDPGTKFMPNWHYQAQAFQLERVFEGEIRRLCTNVAPRSCKSILASIALPMFWLGHRPHAKIICVSHTKELARDFSIKRRIVAQSDWYREAFPAVRLVAAKQDELRTSARGYVFASGFNGSVLGRGADLIVIDDPLKGLDAFSEASRRHVNETYDNVLVTRLNDKQRGAIVLIMQRLHENDLTGHVTERETWERLSLPAIAQEETVHQLSGRPGHVHRRLPGDLLQPEREPMEVLENMRRTQGSLVFEAQYQQQPIPAAGNIIRRSWLHYYDAPPMRVDRTIVSWDTASTLGEDSDWTVGTVWASVGLDFYLLKVIRQRIEAPDLRRLIVDTHKQFSANATLIEDADIGTGLIQDLRRTTDLRPIPIKPKLDKEARLLVQAARFEAGQVHLPREAPWLGEYTKELLAFPLSAKKDQVDSTSQALSWLTASEARLGPIIRQESIPRRNVVRRNVQ